MRASILSVFAFGAMLMLAVPSCANDQPPLAQLAQDEVTCYAKSEQVSGTNKICFYDCMGSEKAINVRADEICPLTIKSQ